MRHLARIVSVMAMVAALGGTRPVLAATPEQVSIPSPNGTMVAYVYKPQGKKGPYPVLVFAHGRTSQKRGELRNPIPQAQVAYWTRKGFAVVAPIRPGYGASGGRDVESAGAFNCTRVPDFARVAHNGAKAVTAAVDWSRAQPWALRNKILIEGVSVGGMATVAAAAQRPAGVIGYINFAGGDGGGSHQPFGKSCHPEAMTSLYRSLASQLPGIWFYASNDQLWGAGMPKQWAEAYKAGGGHASFVFTGPTPNGQGIRSRAQHRRCERPGWTFSWRPEDYDLTSSIKFCWSRPDNRRQYW